MSAGHMLGEGVIKVNLAATHTGSLRTASLASYCDKVRHAVTFFQANDERMHPYQRGRAAITGLRLKSGKIIETGRLVGVAWRGLFSYLFSIAGLTLHRNIHNLTLVIKGDANHVVRHLPRQGEI